MFAPPVDFAIIAPLRVEREALVRRLDGVGQVQAHGEPLSFYLGRLNNLAKRSFFPVAMRKEIGAAGYRVADAELAVAMTKLDAIRRGERMDSVPIRVTSERLVGRPEAENPKRNHMAGKPAGGMPGHRFLEADLTYPDPLARARYDWLVGLDEHKHRLLLELELLLYPTDSSGGAGGITASSRQVPRP